MEVLYKFELLNFKERKGKKEKWKVVIDFYIMSESKLFINVFVFYVVDVESVNKIWEKLVVGFIFINGV